MKLYSTRTVALYGCCTKRTQPCAFGLLLVPTITATALAAGAAHTTTTPAPPQHSRSEEQRTEVERQRQAKHTRVISGGERLSGEANNAQIHSKVGERRLRRALVHHTVQDQAATDDIEVACSHTHITHTTSKPLSIYDYMLFIHRYSFISWIVSICLPPNRMRSKCRLK